MTNHNNTNTSKTIAMYSLYMNGTPFNLDTCVISYRESVIQHIVSHLNAVSNNIFTAELVTYIEKKPTQGKMIETSLYGVLRNDKSIQTHQRSSINKNSLTNTTDLATTHTKDLAETIQHYLQAVSDDVYTLELHSYKHIADGQQATSYIDSWEV